MAFENDNLKRLESELLNNKNTSQFGSPVADALYRKQSQSDPNNEISSTRTGINTIIELFKTQINIQTEQTDILRRIAELLANSGPTKSSEQFKARVSSTGTNFANKLYDKKSGFFSEMWQSNARADYEKQIDESNRKLAKITRIRMSIISAINTPASAKFRPIMAENEMDYTIFLSSVMIGIYELNRLMLEQLVAANSAGGTGHESRLTKNLYSKERTVTNNFETKFTGEEDTRSFMQKVSSVPLIGSHLVSALAPFKELLQIGTLPERIKLEAQKMKVKMGLTQEGSIEALKANNLYRDTQQRAFDFIGGEFIRTIENIRSNIAKMTEVITGEDLGVDFRTGKRKTESREDLYDVIKGRYYNAQRAQSDIIDKRTGEVLHKKGDILRTAEQTRLETEDTRKASLRQYYNEEIGSGSGIFGSLIQSAVSSDMLTGVRKKLGISTQKEMEQQAFDSIENIRESEHMADEIHRHYNVVLPQAIKTANEWTSMFGVASGIIGTGLMAYFGAVPTLAAAAKIAAASAGLGAGVAIGSARSSATLGDSGLSQLSIRKLNQIQDQTQDTREQDIGSLSLAESNKDVRGLVLQHLSDNPGNQSRKLVVDYLKSQNKGIFNKQPPTLNDLSDNQLSELYSKLKGQTGANQLEKESAFKTKLGFSQSIIQKIIDPVGVKFKPFFKIADEKDSIFNKTYLSIKDILTAIIGFPAELQRISSDLVIKRIDDPITVTIDFKKLEEFIHDKDSIFTQIGLAVKGILAELQKLPLTMERLARFSLTEDARITEPVYITEPPKGSISINSISPTISAVNDPDFNILKIPVKAATGLTTGTESKLAEIGETNQLEQLKTSQGTVILDRPTVTNIPPYSKVIGVNETDKTLKDLSENVKANTAVIECVASSLSEVAEVITEYSSNEEKVKLSRPEIAGVSVVSPDIYNPDTAIDNSIAEEKKIKEEKEKVERDKEQLSILQQINLGINNELAELKAEFDITQKDKHKHSSIFGKILGGILGLGGAIIGPIVAAIGGIVTTVASLGASLAIALGGAAATIVGGIGSFLVALPGVLATHFIKGFIGSTLGASIGETLRKLNPFKKTPKGEGGVPGEEEIDKAKTKGKSEEIKAKTGINEEPAAQTVKTEAESKAAKNAIEREKLQKLSGSSDPNANIVTSEKKSLFQRAKEKIIKPKIETPISQLSETEKLQRLAPPTPASPPPTIGERVKGVGSTIKEGVKGTGSVAKKELIGFGKDVSSKFTAARQFVSHPFQAMSKGAAAISEATPKGIAAVGSKVTSVGNTILGGAGKAAGFLGKAAGKLAVPLAVFQGANQIFTDFKKTGNLGQAAFGISKEGGMQGAMEGASKYGLMGMGLGSVLPGIGTAIGGAIGTMVGGIMGYFGADKVQEALTSITDTISDWNYNISDFFYDIGDHAGSFSAKFSDSKVPFVMPILGGAFGSIVDALSWIISSGGDLLKDFPYFMEKFDRSIQDFFTGEYSHRGAELGSAIPLIGTILGGVLGSVIDGVSWVFKSEDQGGGGGIVKSYGKITDMVNDQIVNLFSFGTYAKMGAELGRDSPYFSMAAALFGGLIGSIADAAAFLFGEKALDSLRDISLSSIDKGIVSVFSSYDSLAGEWASYGLNGVPLLSPIIYGLMGVLGAFFKGFIDDEFFAKVERLWYTAKAKFWSLIGFDDNSKENQAEVDKLDKRITEIQVEKDKQYQARKAQREAQRKAEDEQRAKDRAERDKKHAEDIARRNATRQVKHGANPPPEVQTITQQQLAEKHIVSVELDSGKAISEIDAKLKDVEKVSLRYDDGKVEESTVGKLRDMFKSFSENVVAGVSEAAEKGKEIYGKLKDKAAEATEDLPQFTSDAREAMSSFGDSVVEGTKWLGNSIFTGFKSLSTMFISMVEKMSGWFEQNAPDYYKESIQPMLASAKESVTDMNFGEMANKAYEATKKFTKETALPALESGADKVGELASRAADKAKEGYEAAKPIVSKAAETTAAVAKDVVHDVADVGSRAYEGAKGLAKSAKSLFSSQDDFVKKMYPAAKAVGTPVGIAPEIILAQAGLESGWGKSLPVNEDGTSSFNFFGIKAGPHWTGKRSARTGTHEFTGGSMHGEKATFRSYDSPEEGFKGYISFLQNNQRYSNAFQHGNDAQAYFTALKQDGYATDPNYVSKTVGTYNKVVKIVGGKSNVDPHQEDQSKVNTSAQTGPKPSLVSRAASAVAGGAMSFATHGLAYLADLEKRTNERLASEGKAPIKTVFGDMLTRTNEMQNDNGPPDSTEKPSQDNSNQEQTVEVKPAGSLKGFETGYPNQIPFTHNASDRVHLNRIHPEVYNRLVGMAKEYHDITGHSLTIKSAYRTPEEQARSIKSARPGYAARQGKSMHQWGYALDINTDHVNALASTASKKTGKPLLETYGFRRPMMTQKLYEPWHIEPIEIAQDRFKIPDGLVPKLSSYGKFVEESKIEQKKENNKEIPSVTANTGITPPPNLDKVDNTPVSKDQIQEDEAEGDVAPEGAKIETPTTSQPAAPVQSSAPAVQQEVAKSEEKKMEESTESPVKVPEIASPKSAVQEAVKTKETGMYSDFDKNAKPKTPEELKVLVEKAQSKTGTASSAPAIQQEVAKPIETTTIPKSTETGTASSAPAVQQAIKGFDYSDMSRGHMRVPVGTGYLTMTKEEYDQRLKDPNFTTTENPWKTASYQLKQGTWSNEAATSHASDIKGQQDLYAKITGTTSSAPAVQQLAAGTGTASSAPAVQQEVSKPKYELTASEQAAKNTQSGLYNFVRNIFKSDEDKLKEYRNERNRIETERGIADSSLNPDGSIKLEKTTKSQVAGVTSPPISDDEVKSKLEAQNKEMDAVNAELETAQANYKTKSADIESQYKSGKITKEEHDSKISNLKEGLKTVLAKVDETEKRWDKESASWNNSAYKEATKTKDKDIQLQVDNETGTTSSAPAVQQEVSKSTTSEQTANIGASPDVNSYLRETERYYKDSDAFESGIKSAREGFKARSAEIDTALKEGKITQDQANAQRKEAEDAKTKAIDKLDGSSFQQRRNDLLAQAKGLSSSSPEVQKMIVSSSSYFKDINTVQDEKNKINDIRKQYQSGKLSKKDALSKLNTFDPAILKRENNEDEDQKARDQYTERRKEIETQITGLTTQVPTPSQSKEPQNAEPQIEKPGIFQTLGNTVKSIFSPRQSQTPSLTTDLRQYIGANKHFNVNELSAQLAYKNAGMISPDKFNPFSAIKNAFTPNVAQPISRTDNSIFHKTETENLEDKSKSETKIETDKSISKSNENANLDTSNSTISNSQNTSINPINISHSNNVTTSPSSMETVKYDPELDNIINTLFAAIPDAFKSNTVQFSTGFGI